MHTYIHTWMFFRMTKHTHIHTYIHTYELYIHRIHMRVDYFRQRIQNKKETCIHTSCKSYTWLYTWTLYIAYQSHIESAHVHTDAIRKHRDTHTNDIYMALSHAKQLENMHKDQTRLCILSCACVPSHTQRERESTTEWNEKNLRTWMICRRKKHTQIAWLKLLFDTQLVRARLGGCCISRPTCFITISSVLCDKVYACM